MANDEMKKLGFIVQTKSPNGTHNVSNIEWSLEIDVYQQIVDDVKAGHTTQLIDTLNNMFYPNIVVNFTQNDMFENGFNNSILAMDLTLQ